MSDRRLHRSLLLDGVRFALVMLTLFVLPGLSRSADAATCSSDNYVCTETIRAMWLRDTYLTQGDTITFATSNLVGQPGGPTPDTLVYVVSGLSWQSMQARQVIARDDDSGAGLASSVSFTVPSSNYYMFIVTSFSADTGGHATVSISRNGSPWITDSNAPVGTFRHYDYLYIADTLLAAKSPSSAQDPADPDYHDTMMLTVPGTGGGTCNSGNCGTARFNDDDLGALSRVEVGATGSHTTYVGVATTSDISMSMRFFWLRGLLVAIDDADGDGLPEDVESYLGTCDSSSAPTSSGVFVDDTVTSCGAFASWIDTGKTCSGQNPDPDCWDARDTDHDGITDFEEVYGLRRCFEGIAAAPYHDVGPCIDTSPADGHCDSTCSGAATEVEIPVSALDSPYPAAFESLDPQRYDVLVEAGYLSTLTCSTQPGSTDGHHHEPNARWFDQVRYTYQQEGLECIRCAPTTTPGLPDCVNRDSGGSCCDNPAQHCPTDERYAIHVHVFPKPLVQHHDGDSENGSGVKTSKAHARFSMTADRRDSGIFRFGELSHGGGATRVPRFWFAAGNASNTPGNAGAFIHELAHDLDLEHTGSHGDDLDNFEANYPSIMNYSVGSHVPLKDPDWWHASTPVACGDDDDCTDPTASRCRAGYCLPACAFDELDPEPHNWPIRFSRGTVADAFNEASSSIAESGLSQHWFREFACDETLGDAAVRDRFVLSSGNSNAYCLSGSNCLMDFDRNGLFIGTNNEDINGVRGIEDGDHTDHDDWARMFSVGRLGLRLGRNHDLMFFDAPINAPDECWSGSSCTSSCLGETTIWNRMGWQPAILAENVQYLVPPGHPTYRGPRAEAAYFRGTGFDDRIELDSSGDHFDMMWDTIENPAAGASPALDRESKGFSIRMWARPEIDANQTFYGLLHTDQFSIYLRRLSGPHYDSFYSYHWNVSLYVLLNTTTGVTPFETCWFATPSAGLPAYVGAPQGWMKVGVEFNHQTGTLTARYDNGGGHDQLGWDGTTPINCQTQITGIASNSPQPLGPVKIGQGTSGSLFTFAGYIDDIRMYNYANHGGW